MRDTAGSAAAPAARWRNARRGSFISTYALLEVRVPRSVRAASTARQGSAFREMIYSGRQSDPMVHQLLVDRVSRGRKLRVRERSHRNSVFIRESITLPINVAAAIRTEMKADLVTAVGIARVNLARALDPHLAFQVGSAGMHNCTCSALTCCAVANIDAIRLTGRDDPQRPAMAQCRSFHCLLPSSISRFVLRATMPKTYRCLLEGGNMARDAEPLC